MIEHEHDEACQDIPDDETETEMRGNHEDGGCRATIIKEIPIEAEIVICPSVLAGKIKVRCKRKKRRRGCSHKRKHKSKCRKGSRVCRKKIRFKVKQHILVEIPLTFDADVKVENVKACCSIEKDG
ncbi:hypothetical protein [Paenibacillus chungangensis]|uniref:Uncharacterized protein n=1 Tax=Paenibacillus chungangensis TaxID=696535 RepID=A0ABW3HQB2_9BACL